MKFSPRLGLAAALALVALPGLRASGTGYADVPSGHWAADSIRVITEAGVMEGFDGRFHGEKLLNRYQVATVLARVLGRIPAPGEGGVGVSGDTQTLLLQMADELALLDGRFSTLQDHAASLTRAVSALSSTEPEDPRVRAALARKRRARAKRMGYWS